MENSTIETIAPFDNTLFVKQGYMAAIGMFAGIKDIRHKINSICIDTGPTGSFIVATCGHTMAVHQVDTVARDKGQFIMPIASLATTIKNNKKATVKITLPDNFAGAYDSATRTRRTVTVESTNDTCLILEAEDTYPDWRRVARYDEAAFEQQVFFDPVYGVRVDAAANLIMRHKKTVHIRPGGTGCGFATLDCSGLAVAYIMPMRCELSDLPTKPNMAYE